MQDTIHISGIGPLVPPDDLAVWPPASGWYLLSAVLLLFLIFLLLRFLRSRRRNEYRRRALRGLEVIRIAGSGQPGPENIAELNRLLKITAMHHFSRERVASLSGKPWLEFLNKHCRGCDFTLDPGNLLEDSGFRESLPKDITPGQWSGLLKKSERWIIKHR